MTPLIRIRKSADWFGRPVWTWRCTVCPRQPGRKPVGGDHRVSTFTSRSRPDYPRAFDRCLRAGLRHVHVKHEAVAASRAAWNRRLVDLVDEACRIGG